MAEVRDNAHFPAPALIDAYGNGGFRFAEMSHRGSILCLPSGIYSWSPTSLGDLLAESFSRVVAEADAIEILLIGIGPNPGVLPTALRDQLRESGLRFDVMATGPAVRTYNVLLSDERKVAASLIAVESA